MENKYYFYLIKEIYPQKYSSIDNIYASHHFEKVCIIDNYSSFLWVERFDEPGEFNITIPFESELCSLVKLYDYIYSPDFDNYMIVEKIDSKITLEGDVSFQISGRSLESLLDRRIIGIDTLIEENLEDSVRQLIYHCFTSQNYFKKEGFYHRDTNLVFEYSNDSDIYTKRYFGEFNSGDDCLTMIETMVKTRNLGFKIYCSYDNCKFILKLRKGLDHSKDQKDRMPVIFSQLYENLLESDFQEEGGVNHKNRIIIPYSYSVNSSNGAWASFGYGTKYHFDQYCGKYIDSESFEKVDLSSDASNLYGNALNGSGLFDYVDKTMNDKLRNKIQEFKIDKTFDTKTIDSANYTYKKEYNLGDIIQVEDRFGNSLALRVGEFTWTYDGNGVDSYPSLKDIVEEED